MQKHTKKGSKTFNKKFNHHDILFKEAYSDPQFAKELFKLFLKKKEFSAFNWDDLKPEKDTFKDLRADLMFSVTLKSDPKNPVKIYLLTEHKSQYSKKIYCQMLKYKTLAIIKSFEETGKVCPVFSFLFYHGKEPWPGETSLKKGLWGWILSKIPFSLRKYMLDSQLIVLDANSPKVKRAIKDKKIKSRGFLNLFTRSWVLRANAEELKKDLSLFDNWSGDRDNLLLGVGNYFWSVIPGMTEKLWKGLEQDSVKKGIFLKGGYMNTKEYIKEEGRMEGLTEGRMEGLTEGRQERNQEVILNMLKRKLDISLISEVTGLSAKEIKKLQNGS